MSERDQSLVRLSVAAQALHDTCIKAVWDTNAGSRFWNHVLMRDIEAVTEYMEELAEMEEREGEHAVD